MLAAKCALAIRVDALGEETNTEIGLEHRAKLEHRMKRLEDKVTMDVYYLINFVR
jgi:nucleolar protein 58